MLFTSKAFSKDDSSRVVSLQGEYDVKHDVVLRVCRRNKRIGKKERKESGVYVTWWVLEWEEMAVGDLVLYRHRSMDSMGGGHLGPPGPHHLSSTSPLHTRQQLNLAEEESSHCHDYQQPGVAYLPSTSYLCDLRHDADEASTTVVPAAEPGVVSRWRMKDRVSSQTHLLLVG